jgi:hypothetical protein
MNSIMQNYYHVLEMYQALRDQLLDILTDADLAYRLPGENPSLGFLCREIGEVELNYIQSFKTFSQDFSLRGEEPNLESDVSRLTAWLKQLDAELKAAIEGLSEADLKNRVIDRGGGFTLSPQIQLEVYKEALLIFYGKVSVYLKAMNKPRPKQWQEWIA